jgi:hypothetical protein
MARQLVLLPAAALVTLLAACTAPAPAAPSSAPPEPPSPYVTAAPGANGPGTPPGPGIFPIVPATHAHMQLQCPLVSAVHYDSGAIPAAEVESVYVCTTVPYTDAPDGTPQIEEFVDRVASADIPALLEAYAVPDAERTDGLCSQVLFDPLIIWLHYGDEQITPVYAPRDECGEPADEAADVYRDLELHRVLVAREKTRT